MYLCVCGCEYAKGILVHGHLAVVVSISVAPFLPDVNIAFVLHIVVIVYSSEFLLLNDRYCTSNWMT